MDYRETDDECDGCGSTAGYRATNKKTEPQGLSTCPHCGSDKCCMCDMGDEVECGQCQSDDS